MESKEMNFDTQNSFQKKLKKVKDLLSELVGVHNDINVLHNLNSSDESKISDQDSTIESENVFCAIGSDYSSVLSESFAKENESDPTIDIESTFGGNDNSTTYSNMMAIWEPGTIHSKNQVTSIELVNDHSLDDDYLKELFKNQEEPAKGALNCLYYIFDNVGNLLNVENFDEQHEQPEFASNNDEDVSTSGLANDKQSKQQPLANQIIQPSTSIHNNLAGHRGCDNRDMFIPTSGGRPKLLCCMYCLKRYPKLERHLRTVHKNEAEVKKFLAFAPRTKNRQDIIARIRKRGQFIWNSDRKLNCGELSVCRRPNKKFKKEPWQIITCANCVGTYSSNTVRTHWRECTNNTMKGERIVIQLGRAVEARIHHDASGDLNNIFAKIRDDKGIRMIRFDWLVICYGNDLCMNYSPHYQEGYISSKVRAVAKVLRLSKSISPGISDLSSLFHVKYCNTIVEVIRQMGKFDHQTKLFKSPGTALTTITLINTIGDLLLVEAMRVEDLEKERAVERFGRVFKKDMKTKILKLVAVSKAKYKRLKKLNIPTTADVNKLVKFLDTERDKCYLQLTENYSYQTWLRLSQLSLVSIMVFNRKRAGEMRNMEISLFHNREIIAPKEGQQIKSRMQIRGKLDRTVPVFLKNGVDDCIEILIRYRQNTGISDKNDFLFAVPTQSFKIKTIDVWAVINSFASVCGADNPSSLKGTNLRKHLASYCATRKLTDTDVTNLSSFMGHDDETHRNIYRNNPLKSQLKRIAPLLDNAQGNISRKSNTRRAKHKQVEFSSDSDSECSSDSEYSSDSCEDESDKIFTDAVVKKKRKPSKPRVSTKKSVVNKVTMKRRSVAT